MNTIPGNLLTLALEGRFDVIIHGCNCQCRMGRGIALAIREQFPEAFAADNATTPGDPTKLGTITTADILRPGVRFTIVNAYTQLHWKGDGVLANYDAIRSAFAHIKSRFTGKRIGYPKIGAGLARGDWSTIAAIIEQTLAGEDHTLVAFDAAPTIINFYSTTDEYGCFSNFSAHPIRLDGKTWPTTEHYFQAQKFEDPSHREQNRQAKSPMIAARMGRDRKKKLRPDWESAKITIMTNALRAKFTQHPDLRQTLLSTAPAKLVEHTENDNYWGDAGDGTGKNMLGQLLMRIRDELNQPPIGNGTST